MNLLIISWIFISYFIAAIPFGLLIANINNVDIRNIASGNIGATNVYRAMGAKYGILVFFLDALKGGIPTYVATLIEPLPWFHITVGTIVILGHSLSCYVKFKGGKGVATGAGVILALSPLIGLSVITLAFLLIYFTRYVALTSIICSIITPLLFFSLGYPNSYSIIFSFIGLFIIFRHRSNIKRLLEGTENKV
tara:strand:- start:53 stop:634 length:582 start_codon:yes stop_codon:yes gene_type:complete